MLEMVKYLFRMNDTEFQSLSNAKCVNIIVDGCDQIIDEVKYKRALISLVSMLVIAKNCRYFDSVEGEDPSERMAEFINLIESFIPKPKEIIKSLLELAWGDAATDYSRDLEAGKINPLTEQPTIQESFWW